MSQPEDAPTNVVPFIKPSEGHLLLSLRGRRDEGLANADRAQRNLVSINYLDTEARLVVLRGFAPAERALAPKHLVFAMGLGALALHEAAGSEYAPITTLPTPDDATILRLAELPELLHLAGDRTQVRKLYEHGTTSLLKPGWEHRILCANGWREGEATHRDLRRIASALAEGATKHHRVVDVLVVTDNAETVATIPTLDPTGVELAAWAQWADHLACSNNHVNAAEHQAAVIRLGAALVRTRTHHDVPRPSPARLAGTDHQSVATRIAQQFFREFLGSEDAIVRAANAAGCNPDVARAAMIDARRTVIGSHLSVVRGS